MWCTLPIFMLVALASSQVVITKITPHLGPTTGNTRVTVRGLGLESDSTRPHPVCRFGNDKHSVPGTYVKCTPEP